MDTLEKSWTAIHALVDAWVFGAPGLMVITFVIAAVAIAVGKKVIG